MFFKKSFKAPNRIAISKTKRRFSKAISLSQQKIEETLHVENLLNSQREQVVERQDGVLFRNKMSKFCRRITIVVFIIAIILFVYLFYSSSGTYLSAWFISLCVSVFLLFLMSFPRSLKVTDTHLYINCVLEVTQFELSDIKRIHTINRYRLKRTVPVFGSYGFGGFFGLYIDLIHLRFLRLYATNLNNLVFIQNIYNDRYIVSCENSALFIEKVRTAIDGLKARNEESHLENSSEEQWDDEDE